MARRFDTLTLLTDLGSVDESVGILRSVARDIAPHAALVDLSHEIGPGDVRSASVMLARAVGYLPSGVVAVCVDAGMTSHRRCVAVQIADGNGIIVGPDNGVVAPAVAMAGGAERAVVLDRAEVHLASPGARWPARDVIAPVAAHLCAGADLADVGTEIDPGLLLPGVVPLSRTDGEQMIADVLWIDRAGVCQLNADPAELDHFGEHVMVTAGEVRRVARRVGPAAPAGAMPAGALGFMVDASGMISLVAAGRSAAQELGVHLADQVTLGPLADGDRAGAPPVNVRLRPSPPNRDLHG